MELHFKNFIGMIIGLIIVTGASIFVGNLGMNLFYFILVIAIIISILPFVMSLMLRQGNQKEKESKFLEFTRDLVENVRAGTPINKGIVNLRGRDYGKLTENIEKLVNQISMGITLDMALQTFAKDTKSKVIARAVTLISEAQRAGGAIDTILESVARSVNQTEELKKERKSSISNLMVQGYIIFFVFIIIMLVLEYSILPLAVEFTQNSPQGLNSSTEVLTQDQLSNPLFIMIITQSIFAGLVIGKISEGSILDGIKHSFILLTITLLITTGTKVLWALSFVF